MVPRRSDSLAGLARVRREKANARERNRMHGQNAVLARLLQCLPLSWCRGSPHKLSKIEILRLAINYLSLLRRLLQDDRPLDAWLDARALLSTLAPGLSRATAARLSAQRFLPAAEIRGGAPVLDSRQWVDPAGSAYFNSLWVPHGGQYEFERRPKSSISVYEADDDADAFFVTPMTVKFIGPVIDDHVYDTPNETFNSKETTRKWSDLPNACPDQVSSFWPNSA